MITLTPRLLWPLVALAAVLAATAVALCLAGGHAAATTVLGSLAALTGGLAAILNSAADPPTT